MIGTTVIDTALNRRGTITHVNAEALDVTVSWRPGQITALRPADIAAGRYQLVLP